MRIMKILYYILFSFWYLLSLLPFWLLYFISDGIYYLLYYVIRYRRAIVRKNLVSSFPEKSIDEIIAIEKEFYSFFCDLVVETVKMFSIGKKNMARRMKFENVDEIHKAFDSGRPCTLYLGHYCNWEWISSLPMHLDLVNGGQIYHPLENKVFDRLLLYSRGRFNSQSVSMKETYSTILEWQKNSPRNVMGYISDQIPLYNSMHYWPFFLNHDTPAFTGAERMSRLIDAACFYVDISRPRRGYYVARFVKLTDSAKSLKKFELTEMYFRALENSIKRNPPYWLWSHNRWKRTRADFERYYSEEERNRILSKL